MQMFSTKQFCAAAAAAALILQPVAAAAQAEAPCVSEAEVSAMALYAMPQLIESVQSRCSSQLATDGFLATKGQQLSARYKTLQTAQWPRAKSAILKIASAKSGDATSQLAPLANLPDDTIRPLVDALIVQELAPMIKLGDCAKIERAMWAIAPIEPQVAGTLIGVIVGLAGVKNPTVCSAPKP